MGVTDRAPFEYDPDEVAPVMVHVTGNNQPPAAASVRPSFARLVLARFLEHAHIPVEIGDERPAGAGGREVGHEYATLLGSRVGSFANPGGALPGSPSAGAFW